jgi:hypothetical protein
MGFLKILASIVCNKPPRTLTTQYLARDKYLDVGREEKSKDCSDHHDQKPNSRHFRSISVRDPTGDDETDDLARAGSVRQTRLPCRGDLVFLVLFVPVSVFLVEYRRSVEVAEEC